MNTELYGFECEHCQGAVRERRLEREAIRHKGSFVILEDVPVGICDKCGARYFHASILRRVAEIGRSATAPLRTVAIPIESFSPTP